MRGRLSSGRSVIAAATAAAILFLGAIPAAAPAAAHENAPPVILDPPEVRPGGVVTVRLEERSPDAAVELFLVSGDHRLSLGLVQTDGEGHASVAVAIPAELVAGLYAISALDGSSPSVSAALAVDGPPIPADGGAPGPKDEDDPLLVALPSGWQQSLSQPAVTAVPVTVTQPAPPAAPLPVGALALVLLVVLGAAAWAVLSARRPASS